MAGPTSTELTSRAQRSAESAGVATFAAWVFALVAVLVALIGFVASDVDERRAVLTLVWLLVLGAAAAAFWMLATLLSGQSLVLRALAHRDLD